jgi:hypothetical protein
MTRVSPPLPAVTNITKYPEITTPQPPPSWPKSLSPKNLRPNFCHYRPSPGNNKRYFCYLDLFKKGFFYYLRCYRLRARQLHFSSRRCYYRSHQLLGNNKLPNLCERERRLLLPPPYIYIGGCVTTKRLVRAPGGDLQNPAACVIGPEETGVTKSVTAKCGIERGTA